MLDRNGPDGLRRWCVARLSDGAVERLSDAGDRYYDANWVWIGVAVANGVLPGVDPVTE